VDDLPPATPAPFVAAYGSGVTHLHWGVSPEADLAGYRLHRGSGPEFVPGPQNLIAAQPDTGYEDPGPAGRWYKLSAMDVHGNESPPAVLGPDGTVVVPGSGRPAVVWLGAPFPSPAYDRASIRFTLPRASRVILAIYDAQGRRVRELVNGVHSAGEHDLTWDVRDQGGRAVANGVYFIRMEAEGLMRSRRLPVMR
jgi:hypothetical protein